MNNSDNTQRIYINYKNYLKPREKIFYYYQGGIWLFTQPLFNRLLKKSMLVIARSDSDEAISNSSLQNRDCFAPFGRSQ